MNVGAKKPSAGCEINKEDSPSSSFCMKLTKLTWTFNLGPRLKDCFGEWKKDIWTLRIQQKLLGTICPQCEISKRHSSHSSLASFRHTVSSSNGALSDSSPASMILASIGTQGCGMPQPDRKPSWNAGKSWIKMRLPLQLMLLSRILQTCRGWMGWIEFRVCIYTIYIYFYLFIYLYIIHVIYR